MRTTLLAGKFVKKSAKRLFGGADRGNPEECE
jgi:hypothetical protein